MMPSGVQEIMASSEFLRSPPGTVARLGRPTLGNVLLDGNIADNFAAHAHTGVICISSV